MRKDIQIPVINLLRGIAAVAVCLYHFVVTTTGYIQSKSVLGLFQYGRFGVQLFFIISGIVIPLSLIRSNYQIQYIYKYLLKRFVRIEPPYLFAIVLGILFLYVRNFVPSSAPGDYFPSITDVLLHLGYLVPFFEGAKWVNTVFWTLAVEFQYYIFLALLFPLALSDRKPLRWVFNAIVVVAPFLLSSPRFFPHWSSFFGLGIFYSLYLTKKYNLTEYIICTILCCFVVYTNQGAINTGIAVVTLSTVHLFADHNNKLGAYLGSISYSLYLLHSTFGSGFINFMSHRFTSPLEKLLVIALGLLISISAAHVLWKLVEKPSQILSKRIKLSSNK
ncbi:MAG: acyltransferase [Flavobacteriales bacterium]|nr:acyltransferase [Flavobacteriales bacterium]